MIGDGEIIILFGEVQYGETTGETHTGIVDSGVVDSGEEIITGETFIIIGVGMAVGLGTMETKDLEEEMVEIISEEEALQIIDLELQLLVEEEIMQ